MSMSSNSEYRIVLYMSVLCFFVLLGAMPCQSWAREGVDPFVREGRVEPIRKALMPAPTVGCISDWPHWRGPGKNGISAETNWSRQWPAQGPKVLWRASVGTGFSSMAVALGRVYTMGNSGHKGAKDSDQDRDTIYCFAADTGKTLWTHVYQSPIKSMGYEGGTSATPTVHQNKVYTISKIGQVFCLNAVTGKLIWERDLVKEHDLKIATWGFASSALVVDDLLVLNAGTHGLALNKTDGSLAWITGQEKAGYSTPVEYQSQGKACVTLFGRDTLAGVVAHTGEVLWEIPWKAKHDENIADPVIHEGKMLVSSYLGGRCALFDLGHKKITERWSHKDLLNWLSTSILWKGHVYGMDAKTKALHCMDFHTGKLAWTQPGFGLGQLMMANGQLIALSDKGRLVIAKASPQGYQELASAQVLQGKCWTVPVLAHGKIYARNATGDLVCLDVSASVSAPK
jgi:outer membrane protein assembly factor BamB